jgi:alkylresorcinol/alkylpyrone synthase
MKPQIISTGFAVPGRSYTQREVFEVLGYPRGYRRLFDESGINQRYFWVDPSRIAGLSFQDQQEEYRQGAIALSREAITQCLDGRSPAEIGCVCYCSCTGFSPGPVIPHFLARDIQFPANAYYCNIVSHGCEGGYPGLKRAADFSIATGRPSLVVACELSSCSVYPEPGGVPDTTNDLELMRANAIFGDAASCVLIGYDDDWRHPVIADTETHTETDYLDELGFIWQNGRLRVRLSRKVPELAAKVVQPAVQEILKRNALDIKDIQWFIIHAAGGAVIDRIRDILGIPEEKTRISRETLRDYGNTSSTSVGITGKRLMSEKIKPLDYAMIVSIGPGMTGGATLLRFGE